MNLIDAKVVEVIREPYAAYGRVWVEVRVTAYGRESETTIMCNTFEEAKGVKPGYVTQI